MGENASRDVACHYLKLWSIVVIHLEQPDRVLLRRVARNGAIAALALNEHPAAIRLKNAGLVRGVSVGGEAPILVLTGSGVQASGAAPWSLRLALR